MSLFLFSEFKLVTTEICKVPSFFSTSIFKKVDTNNTGFVKRFANIFYIFHSMLSYTMILVCFGLWTAHYMWFYQLFYREAFIDYWVKGNMLTKEITTQIYTILKQPDHKYLVQVG